MRHCKSRVVQPSKTRYRNCTKMGRVPISKRCDKPSQAESAAQVCIKSSDSKRSFLICSKPTQHTTHCQKVSKLCSNLFNQPELPKSYYNRHRQSCSSTKLFVLHQTKIGNYSLLVARNQKSSMDDIAPKNLSKFIPQPKHITTWRT